MMKIENNKARLEEFQRKFDEVFQELVLLKKMTKRVKKINSKIREIEEYYYGDWADDVEEVCKENPKFHLEIMEEDVVYEMLSTHYNWCKKMIYSLSKQIIDKS